MDRQEKIIKLPVCGITITLVVPGGGGRIYSEIEESDDPCWNAAMDAIESIVLAHAVAGVDVESTAYLEGLETAIQEVDRR